MAEGGRIGEFPHHIIGDQRLPLRVIIDERLDMLLQEIGSDGHRRLLVHLQVAVRCARSTTASAGRPSSPAGAAPGSYEL